MRSFRHVRVLVATLALAATLPACEMSIDVATRMRADGSGSFRILFDFDKEFVDLVQSTAEGKKSLEQLRGIGESFVSSGWQVAATEPGGGLRIDIERPFDDPADLERALADAARRQSGQPLSFASVFRDFRVRHERRLFTTSSRASGVLDLTPERLAPGALSAQLRDALQLAAGRVFRFRVTLALPGEIRSHEADPERVEGGEVSWMSSFGRVVPFGATAGGVRLGMVALVAGPAAALMGAGGWLLARRRGRRRAAPLKGWDVTSPAPVDQTASAKGEQ